MELAQNAVDAAAPDPVRLLVALTGDTLRVANSGRPLSADGVAALASLRASAKRGQTGAVGRFGVGFAAVLAVADRIDVGSRGAGSVRFDRARTADAVRELAAPDLLTELEHREGHVPALRLPFAGPPLAVPDGYSTLVELTLRDPTAAQFAQTLIATLDPTLPLVLPGLGEITLHTPAGTRIVHCHWQADRAELDGIEWLLAETTVPLDPALFAERPTEERRRAQAGGHRLVVRALARRDAGALPAGAPAVLRAPQPTDDPLTLPVLISAPVPLDDTRRRAQPGPLTDLLLASAGELVAALATRVDDPLPLVPTGLAAGEVDATVRAAALRALVDAPLFPGDRRAAEVVVADLGPASGPAADLLGGVLAELLPAGWASPAKAAALATLGVRRWDTAALVEALSGLDRPAPFWHDVYDALADAADHDALAALPVPLADGRRVTGARGTVFAGQDLAPVVQELAALADELADAGADAADELRLRVVDPAAEHPLLLRLGARHADSADLLDVLGAAVEDSHDLPDTLRRRLSSVVLDLVGRLDLAPGALPWLADLPLPDASGRLRPAGDLVHPDSPLRPLLRPDAGLGVLDAVTAASRRMDVWAAAGVLYGFVVERTEGVALDPGADTGLPDEGDYHADLLARGPRLPVLDELVAIRDLDLVDDWPAALPLLAADPEARAAILAPASLGGDPAPSYPRWWLGRHPLFDGLTAAETLLPGADPLLAGLYEPAPPDQDPVLLAALGARRDLVAILDDPAAAADLADRLGDPARPVSRAQARALYAALGRHLGALEHPPEPPLTVRAVRAGELVVVATAQAVLVDAPDLLPLVDAPVLPAPASCARQLHRVLGVPLASAVTDVTLSGHGEARPVPLDGPWPATYRHVPELCANGRPIGWRVADGVVSARDHAALARALAWVAGHWEWRHALAERLRPDSDPTLLDAEDDLDDPQPPSPGVAGLR